MLELWSGTLSNNAAKVRVALAEKGLDYQVNEVPWSKEKKWYPKPAAFLAVSPRGQVPVLIDEGFAIHDSTVIIEYLEDRYPAPPLFPTTPKAKAECRLWEDEADFQQQYLATLINDVYLRPAGSSLTDAAENAISSLNQFYDRLNDQLAGSDFICGEFSAADISVFMVVGFGQTLGANATQDNVLQWFARIMQRPTVKSEFEHMMATAASM